MVNVVLTDKVIEGQLAILCETFDKHSFGKSKIQDVDRQQKTKQARKSFED